MDILELIKKCNLIYLDLDTLATKLNSLTGRTKDDLKLEIKERIDNGDLFLDEKNKISLSSSKGYFKAKLEINKKGYGFAMLDGSPDIFIPAFSINNAIDGDDCLVEITNKKSENELEGRVVKVLRRNTTNIVGTYIVGKSKNVVFPDNPRYPQIRIFKGDSATAQNNDKVWVELNTDNVDNAAMSGKIIEVLGKANTPKAEQISIIRSYNLVDKFSDKVKNEVKAINPNVDPKKFKKRVDFTEQNIITIDGEDARDFDDAIAIETTDNGYTLYVHIADVSNYVIENTNLDKEALMRGTSVYFPNMVIPMLPKEISNGVCSLQENEYRLTLSCVIELDKKANVLSSKIVEGIIKSKHRMTYTEVQNILNGDNLLIDKYSDVYQDILSYQTISNLLKEQKRKRGEIRMNLPEPFILENADGEIVSIENRIEDESHEIIESVMVLANECVAKTYFDLHMPFVYRVHEKPEEDKVIRLGELLKNMGVSNNLVFDGDQPMSYQKIVDKIVGTPQERTLTKLILRTMMKARYSPTCLGHFGLASQYYCHFTSPIRRYPDLMIHRIIKSYLHGVPLDEVKAKYEGIVERVSDQSSAREKVADEAEREMDDYKKSVYMSKFLGEEFDGVISGVHEFGFFVELENGVEGLVKLDSLPMDQYVYDEMSLNLYGESHHYTIGDSVRIVVANTNTQLHQIDFDLAGVEKSVKPYVIKQKSKTTKKKQSFKSKKSTTRKRRK